MKTESLFIDLLVSTTCQICQASDCREFLWIGTLWGPDWCLIKGGICQQKEMEKSIALKTTSVYQVHLIVTT